MDPCLTIELSFAYRRTAVALSASSFHLNVNETLHTRCTVMLPTTIGQPHTSQFRAFKFVLGVHEEDPRYRGT